MISFIKANSNIFIFIFLIFLTIDSFLVIIKYRNYLESIPNLKISYDTFKTYCFSFFHNNNEYKLAIVKLNLENRSTHSIDITNIKLIDKSKTCLATIPMIKDDSNENGITLINKDKSKSININIISENILNNLNIPSHDILSGYAVFENIEPITNAKNYKIIIETPKKSFEQEITINTLSDELAAQD